MRFIIYFFAFLAFISSWSIHHVSGTEITMKVMNCNPKDHYCGVMVTIKKDSKSTKPLFFYEKNVLVLRELLLSQNNELATPESVKDTAPWSVKCIADFCIAAFYENGRLEVRTNHLDLMEKNGERMDFQRPRRENRSLFYRRAFGIPGSLPMPKLGHTCAEDGKCTAMVSAYGAASKVNLTFDQQPPSTFDFLLAANGIGSCFGEHCAFVNSTDLSVKPNFHPHYLDFETKKLMLNAHRKVEDNMLIHLERDLQIQLVEDSVKGFFTLQCTPPDQVEKGKRSVLSMPIPFDMPVAQFAPILKFKAGKRVAACAGKHCCNYDSNVSLFYVNFKGSIQANQNLPEPTKDHLTTGVTWSQYSGVHTLYELLQQQSPPALPDTETTTNADQRTMTLEVLKCHTHGLICEVGATLSNPETPSPPHTKDILRIFTVHRSLVSMDLIKTDTLIYLSFIPGWTGACIFKFCVAARTPPHRIPDFKMNYPDPLNPHKPKNFQFDPLTKQWDPTMAAPVPESELIPKLEYKCKENPKECIAHYSAFGTLAGQFRFKNHRLNKFRSIVSSNGVGGCFDKYCGFVNVTTLELQPNFYSHYVNVVPKELTLNAKHEVSANLLMGKKLELKVKIAKENEPQDSTAVKSVTFFSEDNALGLSVTMPVSSGTLESALTPFRNFKASNGAGVCAGDYCVFLKVGDQTLYVNFQGILGSETTPSPWHTHEFTEELEPTLEYKEGEGGVPIKINEPEPEKEDPLVKEEEDVGGDVPTDPANDENQDELPVHEGESNANSNQEASSAGETEKKSSSIQIHAVHFVVSSVIVLLSLLIAY